MKAFKTKDSALSYYVNQLENLDKRLYQPLTSVTWGRDIKLRPGITMANESTSFIKQEFSGNGSISQGNGNMPWVSMDTSEIPGVQVNGQKLVKPLRLLAREISYTSVELERSQLVGNSIDSQKIDAMNLMYQMNTDQMVYIGSADVGATGLFNNTDMVTTTAVANGVSGLPQWSKKTPAEILVDVNAILNAAWANSAYSICPNKLALPPAQFAYLTSTMINTAGQGSLMKFIKENSIALETNGQPLDIVSVKWLKGRGVGGTDRMVAYTNEEMYVRFPMVPVRRETVYYQGIRYIAPYLWAFGEVEFVYPETVLYADGI